MSVKYCMICNNNSFSDTDKSFIPVPQHFLTRKQWFIAMGKSRILTSSLLYCCENHFDLKNDATNYLEHQITGCRLKMKKNVVPYLNLDKNTSSDEIKLSRSVKRKKEKIPEKTDELCFITYKTSSGDLLIENRTSSDVEYYYTPSYYAHMDSTSGLMQIEDISPTKSHCFATSFTSCSSSLAIANTSFTSYTHSKSSIPSNKTINVNTMNWKCSLANIEKNSKLFLGLPQEEYYIINKICILGNVNYIDVLITLKIIRLNDQYASLAINFNKSISTISRIFGKTVTVLANLCQEIIYWPHENTIVRLLPISFRARYSDVQCIIDCFEIEIQMPLNPLHQSLSWNTYKKCNTIKYLISSTPNGFINFVSKGFLGRTTDQQIIEHSGFLDILPENCSVIADRGFKHIETLLNKKKCKLIRLPSVNQDEKLSREDVETKRIASLRIHKRVIRRLREFQILLSHSCVNTKFLRWLDFIMIVVCGLINLQPSLIN